MTSYWQPTVSYGLYWYQQMLLISDNEFKWSSMSVPLIIIIKRKRYLWNISQSVSDNVPNCGNSLWSDHVQSRVRRVVTSGFRRPSLWTNRDCCYATIYTSLFVRLQRLTRPFTTYFWIIYRLRIWKSFENNMRRQPLTYFHRIKLHMILVREWRVLSLNGLKMKHWWLRAVVKV